jgi:hypothetical protein
MSKTNMGADAASGFAWVETLIIPVAIAVIILVVTRIYDAYFTKNALRVELRNTETWQSRIAALECGRHAAYLAVIARISSFAQRVWGPIFSWRALGVSYVIAFFYPIFFLLFDWLIFGHLNLAGLPISDARTPWQTRALTVSSLVIYCFILAIYMNNVTPIRIKLMRGMRYLFRLFLPAIFGRFFSKFSNVGYKLTFAFAFLTTVAVATVFIFTSAGVVVGDLSLEVISAGFLALLAVFSVSFFAAFSVGIFVITGARLITDPSVGNSAVFLLISMLPLLNAMTDFPSYAATRWFFGKITQGENTLRQILWGVAFDVMIGVLCFVALLAMLYFGLSLWKGYSPTTLALDPDLYLQRIREDGVFQAGFLLVLLGFTTLLPTLTHVVFGLRAVFVQGSRYSAQAAQLLRDKRPSSVIGGNPALTDDQRDAVVEDVIRLILKARFWAAVILTLLFGALVAAGLGLYHLVL